MKVIIGAANSLNSVYRKAILVQSNHEDYLRPESNKYRLIITFHMPATIFVSASRPYSSHLRRRKRAPPYQALEVVKQDVLRTSVKHRLSYRSRM